MGRAIVREPQAFLMDEPLSNLDAKLRVYMRAELKKLQKDLGVTTIYVTHDQIEAMTMGDRIAILNQGILQQMDSPDSIYSHPSNQFVAGFIGSPPTNFFDCSISEKGECETEEFTYVLSEELSAAASRRTSDQIVLAIRPQDVRVYTDAGTKEDLIKAQIYATEPLGDVTILDMKIGDTVVMAVVSPDFKAESEDELYVSFPQEKVYLFDKKTGQSLT